MTVGLYHPEFWSDHGHWSYQNQTPGRLGAWKNALFRINERSLHEADCVVVHEDLTRSIRVNGCEGSFILVTGEEKSVHSYPQEFLDQFDLVITSRDDIKHQNVFQTFYLNPWRIKRTYDELLKIETLVKTSEISAIVSNLKNLPLQRERITLLNQLKRHYGNKLEWFSKGQGTYINDKWNGLAPFKYSIAIENSRHANYFTEKIIDCFLAYTIPFYAGCPNIKDFFDERSFVLIKTENHLETINTIDCTIRSNFYDQNLKYLKESRRLVMEKYHFIAALTDILNKEPRGKNKIKKKLHPQAVFQNGRNTFLMRSLKVILGEYNRKFWDKIN